MRPPRMGSGEEFDRGLGTQLKAVVRLQRGPSPLAAQARYREGGSMTWSHRLVAGVTTKAAAVATALALTAGGAAYVAAAATTGDPNPVDWSQQVRQTFLGCSTECASPGQTGEQRTAGPAPVPSGGGSQSTRAGSGAPGVGLNTGNVTDQQVGQGQSRSRTGKVSIQGHGSDATDERGGSPPTPSPSQNSTGAGDEPAPHH